MPSKDGSLGDAPASAATAQSSEAKTALQSLRGPEASELSFCTSVSVRHWLRVNPRTKIFRHFWPQQSKDGPLQKVKSAGH